MTKESLKKMSHTKFLELLHGKAEELKDPAKLTRYFEEHFDLATDEHRHKQIQSFVAGMRRVLTPGKKPAFIGASK